mgnify:CR=1 FL=1
MYLGVAYVQSERPHQAIDVLLRAEEMVEDHSVIAQFLGRSYKAVRDYDSAERYLKRALILDPALAEVWVDLGEVFYVTQQYGVAIRHLEEALKRFPNNPALRSLLAMSLYRVGDYTGAAKEWSRVYALRPDSIIILANYAFLLLMLGRTEEAQPLVRRASEMFPNHYRTLIIRGELAFQRGDIEQARQMFELALDRCSLSVEALSRLAVIAHIQGQEERKQVYQTLINEILEREPAAWQRMCNMHLKTGDHDRHLECIQAAVVRDASSSAAWISLAVELMRRGQEAEAIDAWERSIEIRGYIKAYCPTCQEFRKWRIPLDEPFNLPPVVRCDACHQELPLPKSLATV